MKWLERVMRLYVPETASLGMQSEVSEEPHSMHIPPVSFRQQLRGRSSSVGASGAAVGGGVRDNARRCR